MRISNKIHLPNLKNVSVSIESGVIDIELNSKVSIQFGISDVEYLESKELIKTGIDFWEWREFSDLLRNTIRESKSNIYLWKSFSNQYIDLDDDDIEEHNFVFTKAFKNNLAQKVFQEWEKSLSSSVRLLNYEENKYDKLEYITALSYHNNCLIYKDEDFNISINKVEDLCQQLEIFFKEKYIPTIQHLKGRKNLTSSEHNYCQLVNNLASIKELLNEKMTPIGIKEYLTLTFGKEATQYLKLPKEKNNTYSL